MRNFLPSLLLAGTAALALSACQAEQSSDTPLENTTQVDPAQVDTAATIATSATAQLASADGTPHGTAVLTTMEGGLKLELKGDNLPKGTHGIHLHTTGKCEGPKFESAGSHWNPTSHKHGLENPEGAHSGDMPNLVSTGEASTMYSYDLKGASLTDGTMAVLDTDGTAIVIHAKPDDNKTDPSGDSGDRLICGVFVKS